MRFCTILLVVFAALTAVESWNGKNVDGKKSIETGEDLVIAVAEDCTGTDQPIMSCVRRKVFSYVSNLLGIQDVSEARGMSDDAVDQVVGERLYKFATTHEFRFQLPEFLFEKAVVTLRPGGGIDDFDVKFPAESANAERSVSAARGILKKKLIFPLLLLLKLKIKALTPILLVLVGIKAVKAFIMSKISFLLVVGFLLLQLFKKGGMQMPMAMMPAPTEPAPVYGPVPTPSYGPPPATPDTSYGPWEPSNGNGGGTPGNGNGNGPYSRWDAHNLAYSSYQPETGSVKTAQQLKQGL